MGADRKHFFLVTLKSHLIVIITVCPCLALPHITVSNVNQDSRCGKGLGIVEYTEIGRGVREVESE